MTFFGAEVTPGAICWIDASAGRHIQLTNACLLKRARKRSSRVVLEICQPPESAEAPLRVALAVLSSTGLENIKLEVLLTARMGLRIAGNDTEGAVVHVVGNHVYPDPDDFLMDDDSVALQHEMLDFMMAGGGEHVMGDDDDDDDTDSTDDIHSTEDSEEEDIEEKVRNLAKNRRRRGEENGSAGELVVRPTAGKPKEGGLPIITHRSGLKFQDIMIGSGKKVQKGHNVALSYVLKLKSGKVIDRADRRRPFKFRLGIGECVKGFDIGVVGMREGGERHLIVPPELGYGNQSPPGIPRNSTLYFDIAVIKAF